jgi:hypothetical protein
MNRRATGKRYGVEIGHIKVTQYDLMVIQSNARDILLDEQGFDVARAWVTATLNYLVKLELLDSTRNLKSGETV